MRLNLITERTNNKINVDPSEVTDIHEIPCEDGTACCELVNYEEDIPFVDGSIDDLFYLAYQLGYDKCAKDMKRTKGSKEPKVPKGYMVSEDGEYINVNAIGRFKSVERCNKYITEVIGMDSEYCYFDMPIKEFKKLVAAKQKEMK